MTALLSAKQSKLLDVPQTLPQHFLLVRQTRLSSRNATATAEKSKTSAFATLAPWHEAGLPGCRASAAAIFGLHGSCTAAPRSGQAVEKHRKRQERRPVTALVCDLHACTRLGSWSGRSVMSSGNLSPQFRVDPCEAFQGTVSVSELPGLVSFVNVMLAGQGYGSRSDFDTEADGVTEHRRTKHS